LSNMNTTKNCGWTEVLRKGKQLFCLILLIVNMCIHYLVLYYVICNLINVKHKWKFKTGSNVYTCTVSIRRSPLGWKIKWSFKTGDLLKEVKFIWNFLWQVKKDVTFQYRSLLRKVTAWACLTTSKHIVN
jgi:hypothetical protein